MDNSGQMMYLLSMFTALINSLELEEETKKELIKNAEQELSGDLYKVCLNILNAAKPDNLIDCLKKLDDHMTSAGILMNIAGEEVGGNIRLTAQFSQEQRGALIDIVLRKGGEGTISSMTSGLFSAAGAFNLENQTKLVDGFLKTLPLMLQAGMASPQKIAAINQRVWINLDISLRRKIQQKLVELCSKDSQMPPAKPSGSN